MSHFVQLWQILSNNFIIDILKLFIYLFILLKMFIVIDWVDASWKTTQLKLLTDHLEKIQKNYNIYDFPQYDKDSSFMVREYLAWNLWDLNQITSKQASLLYAIDRFYIKNDILNSIQEKEIVLSNRYTTSNIVHQATKLENKKEQDKIIQWIEDIEYNTLWLPKPDKVIFLDMHIDILWELNKKRRWWEKVDIHEKNYTYLKNSYFRALDIAKRLNWDIIQCYKDWVPKSLTSIHKEIKKILAL